VSLPLLIAVAACYLVAALLYVNLLLTQRPGMDALARRTLVAGLLLHTGAFVALHRPGNDAPWTPVQDSISFMAYAVVALWLIFQGRWRVKVLGALVSPLAFFLVFYATLPIGGPAPPETIRSIWPHFHILLSVIGFAFLAIAFAAGLLYLVQDRELKRRRGAALARVAFRLPPLEVLDRVNTICLLYGFPILTIGMIMGALWEAGRAGRLSWEPHITFSLLAWLLYLLIVLFRLAWHQRGRRAAMLSVIGFILLTSSYLGVRALGLGS
jgi:ABC-type uncharacterized transport system permease subunit